MSEPFASVCDICGSMIHNDQESKALHDKWHDAVVKALLVLEARIDAE